MQGSRWKRLVVGKRSEPGEMREPVAWGGEEEEGRKKDGEQGEWIHPSVTLWQTARESQCEASPLPLLVSLLVLPSDRPFAHLSLSLLTSVRQVCPPVHPIVSSSASCHSPRQPLPTLLSHQEFISSPVLCLVLLLRCSFCSLLRPLFLLLVTTVVILVPPQLFLSFPISPDFFKILSSGSLERDRNRDREEGWILESSAYHMRNALLAFRHVEDEDDILDGVPGVWRREGSEKGKGKGMLEAGGARRASVVRPGSPSR